MDRKKTEYQAPTNSKCLLSTCTETKEEEDAEKSTESNTCWHNECGYRILIKGTNTLVRSRYVILMKKTC